MIRALAATLVGLLALVCSSSAQTGGGRLQISWIDVEGGASTLFAVALLCSGQSSTITGTLAGQIVLEGFLRIRIRPWLRRTISRGLAIIPAVAFIMWKGSGAVDELLVLSQVVLSLQLSFAVIPLIAFTSDREKMGEFVNPKWVVFLSALTAVIIVALNANLVMQEVTGWLAARFHGLACATSRDSAT